MQKIQIFCTVFGMFPPEFQLLNNGKTIFSQIDFDIFLKIIPRIYSTRK